MNNYSIVDLINSQRNETQPLPPTNPQMQQIKTLWKQVQGSNNPQSAFQQVLNQNPNMQAVLNLIRSKNVDLKTLAQMMAQQRGTTLEAVINELNN